MVYHCVTTDPPNPKPQTKIPENCIWKDWSKFNAAHGTSSWRKLSLVRVFSRQTLRAAHRRVLRISERAQTPCIKLPASGLRSDATPRKMAAYSEQKVQHTPKNRHERDEKIRMLYEVRGFCSASYFQICLVCLVCLPCFTFLLSLFLHWSWFLSLWLL